MEIVFIDELKPLLDAIAGQMDLYVPKKAGQHYVYSLYGSSGNTTVEFNNIRSCTPAKEFLFPLRELAATFPGPLEPNDVKPFAVFGLKECDLRSFEILDKVFTEDQFEDPFYQKRRQNMFVISTDCFEPGESCFCNVFDGKGHAVKGYDLNVSQIDEGFVIESGSDKGKGFVEKYSKLFSDASDAVLARRAESRVQTQAQLEKNNDQLQLATPINELLESNQNSDIFDTEAQGCIECQACTRVCPTCHCFYLYDTKQKDYFARMKMWDSCMRLDYATVAGGENPYKVLGDRIKHRLMHKFVYFLDRYGVDMCVGCGRCVDADAGGMDLRAVLKKLNEAFEDKKKVKVAK